MPALFFLRKGRKKKATTCTIDIAGEDNGCHSTEEKKQGGTHCYQKTSKKKKKGRKRIF